MPPRWEWRRSQLFIGPNDSLSPCHYDQYDNLFLQVLGRKHFLLMEPSAAEGLFPFPLHITQTYRIKP